MQSEYLSLVKTFGLFARISQEPWCMVLEIMVTLTLQFPHNSNLTLTVLLHTLLSILKEIYPVSC